MSVVFFYKRNQFQFPSRLFGSVVRQTDVSRLLSSVVSRTDVSCVLVDLNPKIYTISIVLRCL